MIGHTNRQTVPQFASVYFQCLMLPQSANVASFCSKLGLLGCNFGYSGRGLPWVNCGLCDQIP